MQPQAECGCSLCKLIDLKSFHPIRDERDRANPTPERNRTYNLVRYSAPSPPTTQPRLLLRSTLKSSMFGTEIIYFSNKLWSRRWFSGRGRRAEEEGRGRRRWWWWWCVAQSNRLKNKMYGVALHPPWRTCTSLHSLVHFLRPIKVLLVAGWPRHETQSRRILKGNSIDHHPY